MQIFISLEFQNNFHQSITNHLESCENHFQFRSKIQRYSKISRCHIKIKLTINYYLTRRLVVVHRCPAVPAQANTAALTSMSISASSFTEIEDVHHFLCTYTTCLSILKYNSLHTADVSFLLTLQAQLAVILNI